LSDHRVNERIRAREVRLIDPEGKQLGVKALPEALSVARQLDLDLVEVAPDANPPVCRIMDYNRFKYDMAQRAKESKRKTTSTSIKEMKYRPKIGPGDFVTKTRQVGRFLEEGHKVKITIMFRGREVSHPELGMKILNDLADQVAPVAKVEAVPKLDGRNMVMVLAPDRRSRQSARRAPAGAGPAEAPAAAAEPADAQPADNGAAEEAGAAGAAEEAGAAGAAAAAGAQQPAPQPAEASVLKPVAAQTERSSQGAPAARSPGGGHRGRAHEGDGAVVAATEAPEHLEPAAASAGGGADVAPPVRS
jgi:translation initiation factor IF-3